jgi:hypothetical protein
MVASFSPILVESVLGLSCFVFAFNRRLRRWLVDGSVWRYGNPEQKRFMEAFVTVGLLLVGLLAIVLPFCRVIQWR